MPLYGLNAVISIICTYKQVIHNIHTYSRAGRTGQAGQAKTEQLILGHSLIVMIVTMN